MPDETKPPETPPPAVPVKPERVPEYVERHELTSALDEIKKIVNDSKASSDKRFTDYDNHFSTLETSVTDLKKPKPEVKPNEPPEVKPNEPQKENKRKFRLWRNPFDQ